MNLNELKIVRFVNFTDEDFVGKWNSVPQLIEAGSSIPMEEWRARHYAKHLINRELQTKLPNGQYKYPNDVNHTSPRHPEEHAIWRELLAKCIVDTAKSVVADHAQMEVLKQQEPQEPKETKVNQNTCDVCEFEAKTYVGLVAHKRKHLIK